MVFQEQLVVTRAHVTVTRPAWVCACGEDRYVRTIGNITRHGAPVERRLGRRVSLLRTVLDMRHVLAYFRAARPSSVMTTRDQIRLATSELTRIPQISLLAADGSGHFIAANEAMGRLTAYSQNELLQVSIWDLAPRGTVESGQRRWRHFLRDGGFEGEYHVRRKTGELIRVLCIAAADVIPGLHIATMASSTDG